MGKRARINLAKTAGFCFGVDRAVTLTYKLLDEGKSVCTLGPLIHNPQAVSELEARGAAVIGEPSEAPHGATVIIRTHGVAESVLSELDELRAPYLDATCPFVKKIHSIVLGAPNDAAVFIAGDKNHPEARGIRGHCPDESVVFSGAEELQ